MRKINFLKWILTFGIIIVLNLFFNFGIATFYDNPEHEDFCPDEIRSKSVNTRLECEEAGGLWTENLGSKEYIREVAAPVPVTVRETEGWCDAYYTCNKEYRGVLDFYERNVFVILVILGILSIIAGFVTSKYEAVSVGLSFGGVLSLIIGTMRYWSAMDDYLRFIVLGIALAALIWLGIKKIKGD